MIKIGTNGTVALTVWTQCITQEKFTRLDAVIEKFKIGQSFLLQRDEIDEKLNQNYLWHHNNFWRLGKEYEFNKKDDYWFKKESDGKKNHDE